MDAPSRAIPCDLLVSAAVVLTQNPERDILTDGAVACLGGTIVAVGPAAELRRAFAPARDLDLGRAMLLPGLINSHTHAPMTLLRGAADDLPLMDWLHNHIFPLEAHLTPELVHLGALLGCAEMIATGTTAFLDMYLLERGTAKAAQSSGLRAVVGEVLFGFPSPAYADLDAGLDLVRAMHAELGGGRVRAAVMPHALYTCPPELLTRSYALAEELDLVWHTHLAETVNEAALAEQNHHQSPVEYMLDLGLLSPRSTLAHVVFPTRDEIDILVSTGAHAVHCPESNMKLASGVAPVPDLLDAGVSLGLGTDGPCSNNNLNMFEEMGTAALLHKSELRDPAKLTAQQALDLATLGGAACLGQPNLGSLAPGQAADFCALDLTAPNMLPLFDPVAQAVHAATGQEVRLTVVDGHILYQDGRFSTIDYPSLVREMEGVQAWVRRNRG
jgi:5-methylthioadenosine/S-adenosylhomocysteine deaminase